ncbi:MAG: hypothetical protein AAFO94_21865, partial [Bacteroidota bacterium]
MKHFDYSPMSATNDHLPPYRVRPRFLHTTPLSASEIEEKIRVAIRSTTAPCEASIIPGFVSLSVLQSEQHYWSPQLSIVIEP